MCKICDLVGQWVCSCGEIVPIDSTCPDCGNERTGDEVGVLVYPEDFMPNRAARRAASKNRGT